MSTPPDIAELGSEEKELRRLRTARNAFAVLAAACLASIALAVPRKIANHRELARMNSRVVELQRAIVASQQQTLEVQAEILKAQQEIRNRLKQ